MNTPEIIATNEGGKGFLPVEPGTYPARCYAMVYLGTIPGEYQGKPNLLQKVRISWELPTERREFKEGEGEQPYTVHKEYTLSMGEKANLRKDLKSWRGTDFTEEEAKRFNVAKLVGKTCTLSIGNKVKGDKTYAEVTGVGPAMKGMPDYKQVNPDFILTYQNWDWDAFATLPEWLRKKMETSEEYKAMSNSLMDQDAQRSEMQSPVQSNGPGSDNDDLPF